MFTAIMMAMACTGQVCCDSPVYYDFPVYTTRQVYVEDRPVVTRSTVTDRFNVTIVYNDGKYRTVPIVNGYAPRIITECVNGFPRVVYDYSGKIPYKPEWQAGRRPSPPIRTSAPPELAPTPVPVPRTPPKPAPLPEPTPAPRMQVPDIIDLPPAPRIHILPSPELRKPFDPIPRDRIAVPRLPLVPVDPSLRTPNDVGEPRIRVSPQYRGA